MDALEFLYFYWKLLGEDVTVFTLKAPVFVWVGSFELLGISLFFLLLLISQIFRLKRRLGQLSRKISKIEPVGAVIDAIGLESLRDIFNSAKNSALRDQWDEFEETFLFETEEDGSRKVFNTRQAEEYFSREVVVDSQIDRNLFQALPGLLTGVGLLLTFLAILVGLYHIEIIPGAQPGSQEVRGIEALISNLSGKFITSITALLCATVFTLFERNGCSAVEHAYYGFLNSLNKRLNRKSSEHLLEAVLYHMKEQSIAFRHFNTDLSGNLKAGVQEGLGPLTNRMVEAIEELNRQKSESLGDSMNAMLDQFKEVFMGSAHNEFDALSSSLESTANLLQQMNTQNEASQQRLTSLMGQLDEFLKRQAESGEAQVEKLQQTMSELLESIANATSGASGALHDKTAEMLERMESASRRQTEESISQTEKISELVGTLSKNMQEMFVSSAEDVRTRVSDASGILHEKTTAILERLESASQRQLEENIKQTEKMSDLVTSLSQRMQETLTSSAENVQHTVSSMLAKTSDWSTQTSNQVGALIEEQTKNASAIESARNALSESLGLFRKALEESGSSLSSMRGVSDSFHQLGSGITSNMKQLDAIQENTVTISGRSRETLDQLSTMLERNSAMVESYERVFSTLDQSIGSVLAQVQINMERYHDLVERGLNKNLEHFDNLLSSVTEKLGVSVETLNESLDDLSEVMEKMSRSSIGARASA